jgi:2-polyprenyl-6-methoxyphenol hydroxylase-like FAD-dependent oxidoreductase
MSITSSAHSGFDQQHAVVIGGSMAGLLAARVLSDHFAQVTIIERDRLSEHVEPRKGVPQGRHVHILLMKGETILRELFPDLYAAFAQDGAVPVTSADLQWYDFGVWKAPSPNLIKSYCGSRPFLEQYVRRFLVARANVRFIDGCEVNRLYVNEDYTRVTGVSLVYRDAEERAADVAADLVVDASGRGSRAPQWLTSLGYGRVEETSVKVDVGYATRIYRRPSDLPLDWKLLLVYPTPPHERRGGLVFPIENDCWMVTLAGRLGEYPPNDEAGFLEYARSLPEPSLYEAIKEAEPVTPIVTYKYAANRWRHYERMARLPEGFVILGEAVCSFNPIYGQGMSVAALEAKMLDACLRDQQRRGTRNDLAGFPQRFQQAIVKVVKVPWMLATGEDFRYPATEGKRPFGMRLLHWYTRRVNELTASNLLVTGRFYEVLHLLKPPTALFDPRIVWAVLRQELASPRQKPGASLTTDKASLPAPTSTLDAVAK